MQFTTSILYGLRETIQKEPVVKVVVVHVGTNDLKAGRHPLKYYSSIRMLVTRIHEFAPKCKILWSTVLPRQIESVDLIEERKEFNESLRMVKRAYDDDPINSISVIESERERESSWH